MNASSADSLRIRTVLDTTHPRRRQRFTWHVKLLVETWKLFLAPQAIPLDVIVIGDEGEDAAAHAKEHGARIVRARAHAVLGLCPAANKLQALREPCNGPLLVVDNDVVFLDGRAAGLAAAPHELMAAPAGDSRVSEAQWLHLRHGCNMPLIEHQWAPARHEYERLCGVAPASATSRWLYCNAGVVLARRPALLAAAWERNIIAIQKAFADHPLRSPAVMQSDQAGFAAAIAAMATGHEVGVRLNGHAGRAAHTTSGNAVLAGAHGGNGFGWLPCEYNCIPPFVRAGRVVAEDVSIVHFAGMAGHAALIRDLPATDVLLGYWEKVVFAKIAAILDERTRHSAHTQAARLLARILAVIEPESGSPSQGEKDSILRR